MASARATMLMSVSVGMFTSSSVSLLRPYPSSAPSQVPSLFTSFFSLRSSSPARLATTFPHPFSTVPPCPVYENSTSISPSLQPTPKDERVVVAEVDALDMKVGRVLKAWKHPEAESLYVEEVDVGEPTGPRIICSGLVNYLPLEELQDRIVVVLANLKARNMRGVKSNGMLLAASDATHKNVELLEPPKGSVPGERIWFGEEGDQSDQSLPAAPNQVQKKKIWEAIQPQLRINDEGFANFQGKFMRTSQGVVTSKSLRGASIS